LIVILLTLACLVSCTDNRLQDTPSVGSTSSELYLRYNYPEHKTFVYRQSIDRREYGTRSGEERLIQVTSRNHGNDRLGLYVVDSLLYTASAYSKFQAGRTSSTYIEATPYGHPYAARIASKAIPGIELPGPNLPLPGLPQENLTPGLSDRQTIPYAPKLPPNSRVVHSTRDRRLIQSDTGSETTLEEKIVQLVETTHPDENSTPGPGTDAYGGITTDSLLVTRTITLSGQNGYLVRSREVQREVHFISQADGISKVNGVRGYFSVNETTNNLELVDIAADRNEPNNP
jgi:hypothetical protein